MEALESGLQAFLRKEWDLETLLSHIDRALEEDPSKALALHDRIQTLRKAEQLSPQVLAEIEAHINQALSLEAAQPSAGENLGATQVAPPIHASTGARSSSQPSSGSVPSSRAFWSHSQESSFGSSGFYPPDPSEPQVGQCLKDRFELLEVLGRGGMSVVFRALDRRKVEASDRNPYVALKLLNAKFRHHPESLKTLQREARKVQQLRHPNIINIYDFDKDERGNYFLTMEVLSGLPLDEVIRRRRKRGGMAPEEAYGLIEQMGSALAAAHRQHIVHSDFKPSNVFLTQDGTIKVFDFGIARAARPEPGEVQETTQFDAGVLGALTPLYASPEMLTGLDPDPRDDVYALGVIAYELLTGRRPFGKRNALQAFSEDIKPKRIKALSRRQWKGLERALHFERKRRTPQVERLLDDLRMRRTSLPKYAIAAALLLLVLLGLWQWVIAPFLAQRRGEQLFQEAATASLTQLPVLAEAAESVPQALCTRIHVRIAGRLLETLHEGTPVQVQQALQTLHALPSPVQNPVYAGLQELLVKDLLDPEKTVPTALLEQLPASVQTAIFSKVQTQLLGAVQEAEPTEVEKLIQLADRLPPDQQQVFFQQAQEAILNVWDERIQQAFSPKAGRYDFPEALEILDQAQQRYPESQRLKDRRIALEERRRSAWQRLNEALNQIVFADPPGEIEPTSVTQILRHLQQLDPQAFPKLAPQVIPWYLARIAQLRSQGREAEAQFLRESLLGFFPDTEIPAPAAPKMPFPPMMHLVVKAGEESGKALSSWMPPLPGAPPISQPPDAVRADRREASKRWAEKGLARVPNGPLPRLLEHARETARRMQEQVAQPVESQTPAQEDHTAAQSLAAPAWARIRNTTDQTAVQSFIQQFSDLDLRERAKKRLALLQQWANIRDSEDPAELEAFIRAHPEESVLISLAKKRLDVLRSARMPESAAPAESAALARAGEIPLSMLQQALKDLGYYQSAVDGKLGPGTRRAMSAFQKAQGVEETGELSNRQRVALIQRAAEAGFPKSQNSLGQLFAEGIGLPKDLQQARRWFQAALVQGDPYAAYNLGVLYREGLGVTVSPDRARRYFQAALAGGHPQAAAALKALPAAPPDPQVLARAQELPMQLIQRALKDLGWLKGAADGIFGPATRRAIRAYQKSQGFSPTGTLTNEQIVVLIQQAAEAGHGDSQNTLGMMVGAGIGVPKDPREAAYWFALAARHGNPYGAYNLGILYREGQGVEKSLEKARHYFQMAQKAGHPQAAQALAALKAP